MKDADRKPWKPGFMFHRHSLVIGMYFSAGDFGVSELNGYRKKAAEVANKAITKMIKESNK